MANHSTPGEKLTRRISARGDVGLRVERTPDGGEIFTGPLAERALRSIGARAMTIDQSIVMGRFNQSDPEHAALYAHERLHQRESGAVDSKVSKRDAEEVAARRVERMVFHRSKAGEHLGTVLRDAEQMTVRDARGESDPGSLEGTSRSPAESGVSVLAEAGKGKDGMVRDLGNWVLDQLASRKHDTQFRGIRED